MKTQRKLRVGVIGLGHQALEDHIPAIKASQDVELVGVVEKDKKILDTFLLENSGIAGYGDLDLLFEKCKPDFVIIATPHNCHYETTKRAIEKGIHVLKEKPFAVSIKQAKELNEIAKKNNVQVSVTLQRRFNPIYYTFFQFIDKIGSVFFTEAKYTFYTDIPHVGWRANKELAGGGCLIDMGYHIVDLLMWYFGLPDKVFAETSCGAKEGVIYDAEDTAHVIFNYKKTNMFGALTVSRSISPKQEFMNVYGTRGMIHIERGKIERYSPSGELQESLQRENKWPSAALDQLGYFVKVIRKEKPNINDPESNLKHLAFIEAAYKSKKEGEYINPHNFL